MKSSYRLVLTMSLMLVALGSWSQSHKTLREWGFPTGIFQPGPNNAITDVPGVTVGHVTCIEGDSIRTGVTAIVPHQGNLFRNKVPAAIYVGNGFGKLAGYTQVRELGNIETPVILTNTLSVAAGIGECRSGRNQRRAAQCHPRHAHHATNGD